MHDPLPNYFRPGEVKALRDEDRRWYRRRTLWLVFYQILVLGPCRWSADKLAEHPHFDGFHFIKPFIMPGMVMAVILIWFFGIRIVFRRRM